MIESNPPKYKVVGTRPIRHDGIDKVTGRAVYGADVNIVGMLHGRILRSPHAHAIIKSIDTSKAEALPGVRAVTTAKDFPIAEDKLQDLSEAFVRLRYLNDNVLASQKALYKGHAIAGVAAINAHIAEEALQLIEVEYQILPSVISVEGAMKDNAPLLHENLMTEDLGEKTDNPSNIAKHFRFLKGNPTEAFKKADVVKEREFRTASVHQGYIESHNSTAHWSSDGHITIWCSTQGSFEVRSLTSQILRVPESKITVIPMEIGGGFGGKIPVYLDPVASILSKKSGHPVKMVMTRTEVFEGTGPTPGTFMKIKMGITKEGQFSGAELSLCYEAGAFPGSPVSAGAMCAFAPYNIDDAQVDGYDVVVNKPKTSAYRAPGATSSAFAVETMIDELCEEIGFDPLECRLKNGAKEGDRRVDGPVFPRIGYLETLQVAMEHPHWLSPLNGSNQGRGIATGFWFNAGGPSSCFITVNSDGTIGLVEGSTDIGGTRVAVAMQAAEVLGIPAEAVTPKIADTDSIGYTGVTGGSSVAFKTGLAAYEAAQDVKSQMVQRVALIWETESDNVGFDEGVFFHKTDSNLSLTFKDLAGQLNSTGGPISGSASVNATRPGAAFAAHIVDVEVDPETGKTQILRYTAIQDVGKAIHPSYVEGQIQGGAVQGIGWALNEEYFFNDEGQMTNPTFLDYRMPISLDLPMIEAVIVEVPNPSHPFGVRGVGEVPIVPPPAAIANAIYRAVGVRMSQLPMAPDRVYKEIEKKDNN